MGIALLGTLVIAVVLAILAMAAASAVGLLRKNRSGNNIGKSFIGLRIVIFVLEGVFGLLILGGFFAAIVGGNEIDEAGFDPLFAIALGGGILAVFIGLVGLLMAGAVRVLLAIEKHARANASTPAVAAERHASVRPVAP